MIPSSPAIPYRGAKGPLHSLFSPFPETGSLTTFSIGLPTYRDQYRRYQSRKLKQIVYGIYFS